MDAEEWEELKAEIDNSEEGDEIRSYYYTTNPLLDIEYPITVQSDTVEYTTPESNVKYEENYAQGKIAKGGAIYALSADNDYNGDFEGNNVIGEEKAQGGAIYIEAKENGNGTLTIYEQKIEYIKEGTEDVLNTYMLGDNIDINRSVNEIQEILDKYFKISVEDVVYDLTVPAELWDMVIDNYNEAIENGSASNLSVGDLVTQKVTFLKKINIINSNFNNN